MYHKVRHYNLGGKLMSLFVLVSTIIILGLSDSSFAQAYTRTAGYCMKFDFDDTGKRFCSSSETLGELKQRHIRLRRACSNANKCKVTQYFRSVDRYYYHSIKICTNTDSGGSTFLVVTDSPEEFLYRVNKIEKRKDSCIESIDDFDRFDQDVATFYVVESGKIEYGGVMPK